MDVDEEKTRCPISDPAHPHTLSGAQGRRLTISKCLSCDKRLSYFGEECRYYCTHCDVKFHGTCLLITKQIRHPFHLQHPLTFIAVSDGPEQSKAAADDNKSESSSGSSSSDESIKITRFPPGIRFSQCTWCEGYLGNSFYYCFICNFCLDSSCFYKNPLPTIPNPKCHHHSLSFFPRPFLAPCDACGLLNKSEPSYVCLQCNYMVHLSCTDLPRVIKITRHPHRLYYTPNLPPAIWSCRVCYKAIDIKSGQFSCNLQECSYAVHSTCATLYHVWDKRELEWVPEELNQTEDFESFKKVGDGLIKYFCHEHHLRLDKYDRARDAWKQCQACVLPIDHHDFYDCGQCYFCLHEVCASLSRKVDHALHNHALLLDPSPSHVKAYHTMHCSICSKRSTGFAYICSEKDSCLRNDIYFHICIRCILVPECFTHKAHSHPLFISMPDNVILSCKVCFRSYSWKPYLQCTLCEFGMCYQCATIPHEFYYKYDEHPLALCYGEYVDDTYWCEVCEKELDPRRWFYTCDKCCITVHRKCLFGSSVYIRHGSSFSYDDKTVVVIDDASNTRTICDECDIRCPASLCYTITMWDLFWCSLKCLVKMYESIQNVPEEQ